jgi:hypothetical protein
MDFPTLKYALLPPTLGSRIVGTGDRVVVATKLTVRSGVVLEKVCEYLYYNQKNSNSKDVSDMDIPPELCLELLIAADYLDGLLS